MKRSVVITAFIAVVLVSFGSGLYAGETTGITNNTIKIGNNIDLTGPSSVQGIGANIGTESFFRYVNDQGGIHGRKVKYFVEDNGYQPATAVASIKKLLHRDKIFATLSWGTVTTLAIVNDVTREKVTTFCLAESEALFTPYKRYLFSFLPSQYRQAGAVVHYMVKTMRPKDLRLGILYQDDEYGRSGLRGIRDAAKRNGIELIGEVSFKRSALNFTSQILQMKKRGANYVYIGTYIRNAANLLKEAKKLGFHPQFFGNHSAFEAKVIELAGEASRGYMGCRYVEDLHEKTTGIAKVRKAISKYKGSLKKTGGLTVPGWAGAMILSEGLKKAGRDITKEGLIDALETIKNFNPDGLMPPITFGPMQREGAKGVRIVKVDIENKILVPVSDWIVPTD